MSAHLELMRNFNELEPPPTHPDVLAIWKCNTVNWNLCKVEIDEIIIKSRGDICKVCLRSSEKFSTLFQGFVELNEGTLWNLEHKQAGKIHTLKKYFSFKDLNQINNGEKAIL